MHQEGNWNFESGANTLRIKRITHQIKDDNNNKNQETVQNTIKIIIY